MAAMSQAQAEATKEVQKAGLNTPRSRGQRTKARVTGLSRQTVYRIDADPVGSEAALASWSL